MKYFYEITTLLLLLFCGCKHSQPPQEEESLPPYPAVYTFSDTIIALSDSIIALDSFLLPSENLHVQVRSLYRWQPRAVVSDSAVEIVGLERCFAVLPISDSVFARIKGCSFRSGSPVKRTDLRYLRILHRNFQGQPQLGEMIVNQSIADATIRIFRELYLADYPIEQMALIDDFSADDNASMAANNTSCFNVRMATGSFSTLSRHAYGKAIDINPLYNPYILGSRVYPSNAKPYVDRSQNNPYFIHSTSLITRLFREEGFFWGGNWTRSRDYQHFQKR